MDKILENIAKKIPEGIRKIIVERNMIDAATTVPIEGSPMQYLFDVYSEFIDVRGEYGNFDCPNCRAHVLNDFKKLKPYL